MKKRTSHKNKMKAARRMMTKEEIKDHVPIFQSAEWGKRREAKKLKAEKSESKNK